MEINHFSHGHPLVLSEEKFNKSFPCNICCEPIFGVSYCCLECKYVLHKCCADLPREFSSQKYHPDSEHPLVLLPSPSPSPFCNDCGTKTSGFVYSCTDCSSNLHVYCALFPDPAIFELPGVKSELTLHVPLDRSKDGDTCLICRNDVDGPILFPNDGRPMYYHFQCVILPRMVKHDRHRHDLSLRLPLDEKDKFFEFICDVCEEHRNPDDCVYYCEPCVVVAHIGCGISGLDRPVQDVIGKFPIYKLIESEEAVKKKELEELNSKVLTKYQFGSKDEAEELDESDLRYVNHELYCSEKHPLVLVKYTRTIKEICAGCSLYVSGMTYSCQECNIYFHKRCTELPKEIHHSMHADHGSLILSPPHMAICHLCGRIFEFSAPVFKFKCIQCFFQLDTCCVFLPNNLNHPSHEHALTPVVIWHTHGGDEDGRIRPANDLKLPLRKGVTPSCQACGFLCDHLTLACESCNFYLHIFCFLLPLTAKHTRHRHTLNLTDSHQEAPTALEFFCDNCEKPRIPNRWVYCCPDPKCDIVSHLECVDPAISEH